MTLNAFLILAGFLAICLALLGFGVFATLSDHERSMRDHDEF